jgi:hypothetical protein
MFVFSPGRMFPGGAVDYCPTGAILLLLLLLLSISSLRAYELKNLLVKSFIIFPMASAKASSPTTGMVLISGMVHCCMGCLSEIEYIGRLGGY